MCLSANQHGSHQHLLDHREGSRAPVGHLDAIIVPTARPSVVLSSAVTLAQTHGCALVVLSSKLAVPALTREIAVRAGLEFVGIDMRTAPVGVLPRFTTDDLLRGKVFQRDDDLSAKRNLALLLSLLAGWRRVVFLDDDITVPNPGDLGTVAGLLDEYAVVGLELGGFPDNSVVCHANREVGGFQDTFIGGGALAVDVRRCDSFFPNIYNDDWFFLLDEVGWRRPAVAGRAIQAEYDPFDDRRRARSQEFGDCMAEGVYAALDDREGVLAADRGYWSKFLVARRRFIARIIERVRTSAIPDDEKIRRTMALRAAEARCRMIQSAFCYDYLAAWRADRQVWRDVLEQCPHDLGPQQALGALGLEACGTYVPARVPSAAELGTVPLRSA